MSSVGRTRRVFVVAAAVVAVTLAFAGPVAAAKTVPVKAWSGSVCKDFGRWEARLTQLGSTGALADAKAGKAAITKFVTGAVRATDRLAKDLKSAGVPSVKHGTAIAAAFADAIRSLRVAYVKAKADAAALPTADPTAFATEAQALAAQLQSASATLGTTFTTTAQRSPASALDKAFTSNRACKNIV